MYEIYAYPAGNTSNKLVIYQPGNNKALVLSPKLTREVSRGGSLTFTLPRDHPCYDSLPKMRTVVSVLRDGKEIWRGRILNHEADWYNRRAVYCEGALSYFNDSCITPFNYEGKLEQFLQHLIDAHNGMVGDTMKQFELGTVTAALGDLVVHYGDADEYGVGEDYGSTWDILDKMILQTFGGYCYCTYNADTGKNVLNYCDQAYEAQRQTAQDIEYGVNLLDLTEKTDTNDLMTRIYPVGNKHPVTETKWVWKILWFSKQKTEHEERYGIMGTSSATISRYLPSGYSYNLEYGWIQNDAAVEKFGVVSKLVEFDTDSDNDTFAAAVQHLQQNSLMVTSYTIKAVDLVDAGYDTERLDFAMYSHIVSAPHSVDAIMLCTKLVEPLDRPDKKEFTFGMTRRALSDRVVANLGKTNLLEESAVSSEKYHQNTLDQLLNYQKKNDAAVAQAAKTATNFISFNAKDGMIIGHESLPDKKVQITNSGVKVLDGDNMVDITADGIEVTDGEGYCAIRSGEITFKGIKNKQALLTWTYTSSNATFAPQTVQVDLSGYSAVLLLYDTYKGSTWFADGNVAGVTSIVLPVNGKAIAMTYPWNTPHWRYVTVKQNSITFGTGYERTSWYSDFLTGSFSLQTPGGDGVNESNSKCRPIALYGFL